MRIRRYNRRVSMDLWRKFHLIARAVMFEHLLAAHYHELVISNIRESIYKLDENYDCDCESWLSIGCKVVSDYNICYKQPEDCVKHSMFGNDMCLSSAAVRQVSRPASSAVFLPVAPAHRSYVAVLSMSSSPHVPIKSHHLVPSRMPSVMAIWWPHRQ